MKCSQCGVTGSETPLYRNNPKGELADWRCKKCLDNPPDPVTKEISEIVLEAGRPKVKEVLAQIDRLMQEAKDSKSARIYTDHYNFCEGKILAYEEVKTLIKEWLESKEA